MYDPGHRTHSVRVAAALGEEVGLEQVFADEELLDRPMAEEDRVAALVDEASGDELAPEARPIEVVPRVADGVCAELVGYVGERRGPRAQAEQMGISLADELLNGGAREILKEVYQGQPPA